MKKVAQLAVVLTMSLWATSASAGGVNVYITTDASSGYYFSGSVKNLTHYEDRYKTTCEYENKHGMKRTQLCEKKISMDDNIRAIAILDDSTTVELYEHPDFRGKYVTFRGRGRHVLPAWMWDKASSLAVY